MGIWEFFNFCEEEENGLREESGATIGFMKPILWRVWHVVRWPLAVLVILYVAIVIYSFPHALEKEKTEETIARINAQKLTIENVNGEHLPPLPTPHR